MSLDDKFEEEMREICEEYYELDKQRDIIVEQLEQLKNYMEITLRKYGKDEFDHPDVPVQVHRIRYKTERMRRGAKKLLEKMLTAEQWQEIYEENEVETVRVTPRKEK